MRGKGVSAIGGAFAALLLAACGSDTGEEGAQPTTTGASASNYSLTRQLSADIRSGKIDVSANNVAVSELILNRDIPITYEYIALLMRTPNAFGDGPACVVCHSSNDPSKSYRGLDLSTCAGINHGATETPSRALFEPGKDPKKSVLGRALRNNRMPLGIGFNQPLDSAPIEAVRLWIAGGAKNDEYFKKNIQPLFTTPNTFAPDTPACSECHMSNQEPPSFHELNLTTHEGIMLGADSVAKGVAKATKVVIPGKPEDSGLFQHLSENRMPPGIAPDSDRDHPNTQILFRWIEQGAKCN